MESSNQIKTTKTDTNHKPNKSGFGDGDGDRNNNAECDLNSITVGDYDNKSLNRIENLLEERNASIEKQSAIINFSVESILNSSPNKSRICANDLNQTGFEMSSNTVYRPLPVRYMPNNNVTFPGEYAIEFHL